MRFKRCSRGGRIKENKRPFHTSYFQRKGQPTCMNAYHVSIHSFRHLEYKIGLLQISGCQEIWVQQASDNTHPYTFLLTVHGLQRIEAQNSAARSRTPMPRPGPLIPQPRPPLSLLIRSTLLSSRYQLIHPSTVGRAKAYQDMVI
jgi:hypothetical protein